MAAGYSGTPQARKLGLKPGQQVCLRAAPPRWTLQDPPEQLTFVPPAEPADVVVAFFRDAASLRTDIADVGAQIHPTGAAWIAWPRKAAGHVSDLTDNVVREAALALGLVDNKVAAIDDEWSGLRVVWRVVNR